MAKRNNRIESEENDYENIRPGNINVNDLFGTDDTTFEENEVEVTQTKEETEDYTDYTFDNSDTAVNLEEDSEEDDVDDDISRIDDSDDIDPIDDVVVEPTNIPEPVINVEPVVEETPVKVEEAAESEEPTVNEKEILDEILNDAIDEAKAVEEPVVIQDAGFEEADDVEIDNPTTEPETIPSEETVKVKDDGTKVVVHPVEETKKEHEQQKKLSAEELYYETETDSSKVAFMRKHFEDAVNDIKLRYTEAALLNYIEEFNSPEDRKLIQDQYCHEFEEYYKFIDFRNNPNLKSNLWVLVIGQFADLIEAKKFNGEIQPILVENKDKYAGNPNIVEDENTTALNEHRRKEFIENSKYGIDRVVWDIDEITAEENTSIFDEQKDLLDDFKKSVFYNVLSQVLISAKQVDMSQVKCKVIIGESSGYYPIIDFNTGVRVYCVDTEDTSQYNAHPLLINRRIPFSFRPPKGGVKTRIIYSDQCRDCTIGTISALRKLVGFPYYKERYKISLAGNYVISYTTEQLYVDMFEKGDSDSKRPGSSTYCVTKPATNVIGVVVLDKKTDRDIKTIHRTQVYRDLNMKQDVSVDNYDPQFVLSAHYIRNDLRLRNPTIPANQRFVEYIITQYVEANPVMIMDGLQTICACIIKEHRSNYGSTVPYSISYEFDRDNLVTPSIVRMVDSRCGLEPSLIRGCKPFEQQQTFVLPPSRRKMDGVLKSEKGRLDVRYFSPQSIQSRYRDQRDLWSRYDLTNVQGRNEFIKSRGFEVFMSPKYMTYDIMPDLLMDIENSSTIRGVQKISISSLADRNSDDTIGLLNKQKEMEYYKSLDDSDASTLQKFMMDAANIMMDYMNQKN